MVSERIVEVGDVCVRLDLFEVDDEVTVAAVVIIPVWGT